MILCITPNPALDRTIILPALTVGDVRRTEQVFVVAGGKGLNVARAIRTLGGEPLCIGFAGGHSGHLLADLARHEGLNFSWTWVNSETRTCTIIVTPDSDATVINEPGLPVSKSDWKRLFRNIRKYVHSAGVVSVSGSLPPNSSADDLHELLRVPVEAGKQVWVDTSGAALDAALDFPGICVKVNGDEIGRSLGFEVRDVNTAQRALIAMRKSGASAGMITLGTAGALLATAAGRWYARGPRVRAVSSVGSGDSFLGGFVSALDGGRDWPEALRDAVASGTANVLSAGGGQFAIQEFKDIREQIQIQSW